MISKATELGNSNEAFSLFSWEMITFIQHWTTLWCSFTSIKAFGTRKKFCPAAVVRVWRSFCYQYQTVNKFYVGRNTRINASLRIINLDKVQDIRKIKTFPADVVIEFENSSNISSTSWWINQRFVNNLSFYCRCFSSDQISQWILNIIFCISVGINQHQQSSWLLIRWTRRHNWTEKYIACTRMTMAWRYKGFRDSENNLHRADSSTLLSFCYINFIRKLSSSNHFLAQVSFVCFDKS